MDQIIKLMTEQVTELLNCQKYFKISDDMLMELASNGVFSIYHIVIGQSGTLCTGLGTITN